MAIHKDSPIKNPGAFLLSPSRRFERYVDLPFAEHGCDFAGVNCWGLVRLIYFHELGIDLPAFSPADDALAVARDFARATQELPWLPVVGTPQPFDCLVMLTIEEVETKMRKYPGHVGVMVAPSLVLHVWRGARSVIMNTDHPLIAGLKVGYYRHHHQ